LPFERPTPLNNYFVHFSLKTIRVISLTIKIYPLPGPSSVLRKSPAGPKIPVSLINKKALAYNTILRPTLYFLENSKISGVMAAFTLVSVISRLENTISDPHADNAESIPEPAMENQMTHIP
jgi:hypothetical protein